MLRGRWQITPRLLIISVAVAGFEAYLLITGARLCSEIYINYSIYHTIRTWLLTNLVPRAVAGSPPARRCPITSPRDEQVETDGRSPTRGRW